MRCRAVQVNKYKMLKQKEKKAVNSYVKRQI